jgi:hypothetical protein
MKRKVALVVGVAAAGAVVFLMYSKQQEEVADLRRQVEQLGEQVRDQPEGTDQVRYVGYPVPTPATLGQRDPGSGADGGAGNAPAPPSPPPSAEQQMKEAHQRYETKFARAAVDAEWAARAKKIADQKLPPLLPEGSTIRSFDCRASLCRLETAHKDHERYMKFIEAAFLRPDGQLWNGATYSTPLNDDPQDGFMVTYIAREGASLAD